MKTLRRKPQKWQTDWKYGKQLAKEHTYKPLRIKRSEPWKRTLVGSFCHVWDYAWDAFISCWKAESCNELWPKKKKKKMKVYTSRWWCEGSEGEKRSQGEVPAVFSPGFLLGWVYSLSQPKEGLTSERKNPLESRLKISYLMWKRMSLKPEQYLASGKTQYPWSQTKTLNLRSLRTFPGKAVLFSLLT